MPPTFATYYYSVDVQPNEAQKLLTFHRFVRVMTSILDAVRLIDGRKHVFAIFVCFTHFL